MKKKICIFTGSRAEYGILYPLIKKISSDSSFKIQLFVSGMHLSPEFGLTYKEIENDGFHINEKCEILLSSDTPVGLSKSMGIALISYGETLTRLCPDLVILIGDRFETICAAITAYISRIPIAHIFGGEATYGVFDEAFRHSITKMSYLHFTATEEYRRRVIQLGEHPERVFNVGALNIDNIKELKPLSLKEIEKKHKFTFKKRNLLITFHPVTLELNTSEGHMQSVLTALDELSETQLIFTKANADTSGRVINRMIDVYVAQHPEKAISFTSMGQLDYLSCMQYVDAVVGNSSSGIIEAPSFKIGTINIGDRQKGRVRASSVIDCESAPENIRDAFKKLYSASFQKNLKDVKNLYGNGNTAEKIVSILKWTDFSRWIKKSFYDVEFKVK
jgi:GDP/UDP-N,N'-diacetylbacillosamine 2-epimerase (hydrolysing)